MSERGRAILKLEAISFGYGRSDALHDVSLEIGDETVALIGANGAGKTTLVHVIAGIHHARAGHVLWQGRDIGRERPHRIVRLGIGQVPEGRQIFPNQSVLVNLRLGAWSQRRQRSRAAEAQALQKVFALFPRLAERRAQVAGTMSGGEQQMLAIGRALMAAPKLLILDEPSMGLAPTIVDDIFDVLRGLRREGIGMLLVEQNARLALEMADRGYVLETGRIAMSGSAADLASDERVRHAYLGA
ncbi:MAG: ABC transporter ATP-binding protein [Sneathiellaceae bacterium]